MLRCPKCKSPGMIVHATPSVTQHFDENEELIDYDFEQGPGEYEEDDTAFCSQCNYTGNPSDFRAEDEEDNEEGVENG